MKQILLVLSLALGVGQMAAAQQTVNSELVALESGDAVRGWEAVGRLDIRNKGFCTAALIEDDLLLTAAHCVYDDRGDLISADRLTFSAGLRFGRAEATRGIAQVVAHPDYLHEGSDSRPNKVAMDIAVLQLDRPIRLSRIKPFPVASRPFAGDEVGVVSYGRSRSEVASLQDLCAVMGRQDGVVVMSCSVEPGSSGSPVFMVKNGVRHIVSVVSAMASLDGQEVSLGTSLEAPLQELLAHFANVRPAKPGGEQRLISIGQRNDTGAKFVSP